MLRFLWITRREVTAAAPAAKKCCWTTSSPQRTSLQHIWSLSIAHQVSSLVAHRRIKTTRSSLLFNYSITQKETVITWNITKSRRVRSVLRWRRAGANWQHLQTLFRRLRKGGRSVRETHHSATLQPKQTAASRTQIFQHLVLMRSLVISLSRCFIFIWVPTLCFFGRSFLLFISSTTRLHKRPLPARARNLRASADTRDGKCTFAPSHNVSWRQPVIMIIHNLPIIAFPLMPIPNNMQLFHPFRSDLIALAATCLSSNARNNSSVTSGLSLC